MFFLEGFYAKYPLKSSSYAGTGFFFSPTTAITDKQTEELVPKLSLVMKVSASSDQAPGKHFSFTDIIYVG